VPFIASLSFFILEDYIVNQNRWIGITLPAACFRAAAAAIFTISTLSCSMSVNSAAWVKTAADAQFQGFLHPYVQTPLWAWILQPVCTQLTFDAFKYVFLFITLLSIVLIIEIVARAWASSFLKPLPLTILLAAIAISTPFKYALWLVQTHALFMMLTVAALYWASRDQPLKAGVLLAIACAVKITPGLLVIYWLVGGRYRAALWFVVCSSVLFALTIATAGLNLTLDYMHSMRRVSNVLLVSFNNQSFAAWLAYSQSMLPELGNWRMFVLAPSLKAAALVTSIAGMVISGWMSKRDEWLRVSVALSFIASTIFSPIAWTHYFLVLIPAVMVLVDIGGVLAMVAVIVTFMLNTTPVAVDPIAPRLTFLTLVRSHFLSAIILIIVVAALCFKPKFLSWIQVN
jgi:hypothetical protein